jgi:hypothetical protein
MSDLFFFGFARSTPPIGVYSKGFIFSICFIPSVTYTASASGVGTPERMTTMDEMVSDVRLAGAPYIMRHLHTFIRGTRKSLFSLTSRTLDVPMWYRFIQDPGHIGSRTETSFDYPRIGEFPHAPQG